MHAAYRGPRAAYFVVEIDGRVWAAPASPRSKVATRSVCELRKMYFLPALRGHGAGHALMRRCLASARAMGFHRCYIETLDGMDGARALYLKSGFRPIDRPMGSTGHFGCNRFYLRDLDPDAPATSPQARA